MSPDPDISHSSAEPITVDTTSTRTTRPEDKVGFWEKTALGAGYLPVFFGNAAIGSFAIPVYQMTLGLSPTLLAVALIIPRFWDAITDPIMGRISDNTHSRFGRRRPFIVVGAILQALAFGAIWMVPGGWSHGAIAGYLVVTLLLFYSCFTVFSVPLASLQYEMTPDYEERTRVAAFTGFFGKAGELGYSWVFPLASLAVFTSVMQGVQVVGWAVAVFVLGALGVIPGIFVRERYFKKAVLQEKVRILPGLRAAFSNRSFSLLVGLTVLQIVAGMLASNLDYYLIVYQMCDGDIAVGSAWKATLSSAYAIVGIAAIYPVSRLASWLGKRKTLALTFVMVLFGAVGKWVLFTPGAPWKILLDPLLCGPVWVAINVLTPSMLADVCDEDELNHGFRREGVFGAIFSWIQKSGYSLAFFGAMWTVQISGFDAALGGAQSPESLLSMRTVLTVSTALWAVAALTLLRFYPLNRQRAYQIRDALEARRGKV